MADMHDLLIVGVPLIVILSGILFARGEAKDLRGEIRDLRSNMQSRFDKVDGEVSSRFDKVDNHLGRIDADMRQFYHLTGGLEARMDAVEKRR